MKKATPGRGIAGFGTRRVTAFAATAALTVAVVVAAVADRLTFAVAALGLLVGGTGLLIVQRLWIMQQSLRAISGAVKRTQAVAASAERTGQRALAAAAQEHTTAAARHQRIDAVLGALRHQVDHDAIKRGRAQTRELEALHQLFGGITPRAPMPSSGQWALNPTDLLALLHLIEERRPSVVVELGSGTSTVWMAYALERCGGRLISLDHEAQYAGRTRDLLAAHRLSTVAEVRDAPLRPVEVRGASFDWYDVDALADVDGIDLLVVDGPPGSTGPMSRYPALDLLRHKLSRTVTVFLDDLSRADEQETLRRWATENPGLVAEPVLTGQHGLLSYSRTPAPGQRAVEAVRAAS